MPLLFQYTYNVQAFSTTFVHLHYSHLNTTLVPTFSTYILKNCYSKCKRATYWIHIIFYFAPALHAGTKWYAGRLPTNSSPSRSISRHVVTHIQLRGFKLQGLSELLGGTNCTFVFLLFASFFTCSVLSSSRYCESFIL